MSYVTVRGTPGTVRVVLWERDPAHPGGEVFIAGEAPVSAGLTEAVLIRIRDGRLDVVEGEEVGPAEDAPVSPVAESWTELDAGGYPVKVTGAAKADPVDHVAEIVPAKYLGDVRSWGLGTLQALAGADLTDLTKLDGVGDKTAEKWIGQAQAQLEAMSQA